VNKFGYNLPRYESDSKLKLEVQWAECSYPKLFVYWIGLYAVVFMAMFANFYRQAYKKPKSDSGKVTNDSGKVSNGAVTNGVKHKEH
jgi:elongation of very long chain fatty acids protein 7